MQVLSRNFSYCSLCCLVTLGIALAIGLVPTATANASDAKSAQQSIVTSDTKVAMSDTNLPSGENIALGKKYVCSPKPTYQHCTDPGDTTQLTDGKLTEGYFWTQKGCVGWQPRSNLVAITIDLGRVEPIQGVSFRTAAGTAGVAWPAAIKVAVSDNGKDFRVVGDLIENAFKKGNPWPEGYGVRRIVTKELHTRGRFVRVVVMPVASYVFCDEIEVFRGPDAWLNDAPGGEPLADLKGLATKLKMDNAVRRRYAADVDSLRHVVDAAKLSTEEVKKELYHRITTTEQTLQERPFPENTKTFRAILPFNDAHAELFAIQAALWKAQDLPPLSVMVVNPWEPSELFTAMPSGDTASSQSPIEIHTMQGEYRVSAMNLFNSTDRPMTVRLRVKGLPGGTTPDYLRLAEVPWSDTIVGRPVMAALPEVEPINGCWTVTVLPGLVRQIWLTLHAVDIAAGCHSGQLVIESDVDGVETLQKSLTLNVYPIDFPKKTTLQVGGWSYTNGRGAYGMTPQNRAAFLQHLQEHYVNAPWANNGVLMSFEFDDQGQIKLDTREMDDWLAQWPDAQRYYVFMSLGGVSSPVNKNFAGAKLGTDEFDQRVGKWITAWVEHLKTKGIGPDRLGILFFDEPVYDSDAASIIKWTKAVKADQPEVKAWIDPIYKDPTKGSAELMAACDILCPNRPMWLTHKKSFDTFYLDQKRQGRELQLYSCSGPVRLLDPYAYYRLQAWQCWKIGGTGSFFWAFGDNGGASSWNPYLSSHGPFTPLFLDDTTVTGGKHMEAIRQSVQDFETLLMLKKAIQKAKDEGRDDASVADAQTLLDTAADQVLNAENVDALRWNDPKDRTTADTVRVKVLKAIVELR